MSPSNEKHVESHTSAGDRPGLSPFALDHRERLAETVVLIPAAGRVPENVMALSNIACPAMVPVAGRPVIYWTVRYLQSLGLRRFVMAVARRGMFVEDFVDCALGQDCEIRFLVPSCDGGVGRTVHGTGRRGRRSLGLGRAGRYPFSICRSTPFGCATSRS